MSKNRDCEFANVPTFIFVQFRRTYFAEVPTDEKYKSITLTIYFNVIDNFTLLSSLVNMTGIDEICLIAIFC